MFKFKNIRFIYFFSFLLIFTILITSCEAPRNGKYRSNVPNGSSAYQKESSSKPYKAKRNIIPISKNYRIKNKRTSGN